jgi:hypothetical protein
MLYECSSAGSTTVVSPPTGLSVHALLTAGRHYYTQVVGAWLYASGVQVCVCERVHTPTGHPLQPNMLSTLYVDTTRDEDVQQQDTIEKWMLIYKNLLDMLPMSLSIDRVYAEYVWLSTGKILHTYAHYFALVGAWSRDADDISSLRSIVCTYFPLLTSACLRAHLSALVYFTFLHEKVVALVQLIDKVGRMPKDRQCRKEVRAVDDLHMRVVRSVSPTYAS